MIGLYLTVSNKQIVNHQKKRKDFILLQNNLIQFMMVEIKNEIQYQKSLDRIEELLQVVGNNTLTDDQNYIELNLLSDLAAEYEKKYHPGAKPSLSAFIRLHRKEKGKSVYRRC